MHYYCKRVVAVPGDTVFIENGILYVNEEPSEEVTRKIVDPGIAKTPILLEAGEFFCIGDNPNNSEDSRSSDIGPVQFEDIIGQAWLRMKSGDAKMELIR